MKVLYFDTETTGTNPAIHEIIQFAAIIEIDGQIVEQINWRCQPKRWDTIEPKALEVNGVTMEQLKTYHPPEMMFSDLRNLLRKYVSKYDRGPHKFYPAGHNVQFDLDFLNQFFKTYGDPDDQKWGITSYQNWRSLDSRVFANFLASVGLLPVQNVKLETLCELYKINIDAHDALSDIMATRKLIKMFQSMLAPDKIHPMLTVENPGKSEQKVVRQNPDYEIMSWGKSGCYDVYGNKNGVKEICFTSRSLAEAQQWVREHSGKETRQ